MIEVLFLLLVKVGAQYCFFITFKGSLSGFITSVAEERAGVCYQYVFYDICSEGCPRPLEAWDRLHQMTVALGLSFILTNILRTSVFIISFISSPEPKAHR